MVCTLWRAKRTCEGESITSNFLLNTDHVKSFEGKMQPEASLKGRSALGYNILGEGSDIRYYAGKYGKQQENKFRLKDLFF